MKNAFIPWQGHVFQDYLFNSQSRFTAVALLLFLNPAVLHPDVNHMILVKSGGRHLCSCCELLANSIDPDQSAKTGPGFRWLLQEIDYRQTIHRGCRTCPGLQTIGRHWMPIYHLLF
ncbi:unnamed protein product [Victoria cruziana]